MRKDVCEFNSDIAGSEVSVAPSKVIVADMTELPLSRGVDVWTFQVVLVSVLTFTMHITHLLDNSYKKATMFEESRKILLCQWSDK